MKSVFLLVFLLFSVSADPLSVLFNRTEPYCAGSYDSYRIILQFKEAIPKGFQIALRFSHAYYNCRPSAGTIQFSSPAAEGYTSVSGIPASLSISRAGYYFFHPTLLITTDKSVSSGTSAIIQIGDTSQGAPGIKIQPYTENNAQIFILYKYASENFILCETLPRFSVIPDTPETASIFVPSVISPLSTINPIISLFDKFHNICGTGSISSLKLINLKNTSSASVFNSVASARQSDAYCLEGNISCNGLSYQARSNAFIISADTGIFWGDFHGHTAYSDGTGTADSFFKNAAAAALDFSCITDHDRMISDTELKQIISASNAWNTPGKFVTLFGWEYNNSNTGHRNFYYTEPHYPAMGLYELRDWELEYNNIISPPPVADFSDFRFSPDSMYAHLSDIPLSFCSQHTTASRSMGNGIRYFHALQEPVMEIYSSHGNSLYPDAPFQISPDATENYVIDALERGYKVGFTANGDSHDGHPGNTRFGRFSGGITAVFSDLLTRQGILKNIFNRACYTTTGNRPVIIFTVNGNPLGSDIHTDRIAVKIYSASSEKLKSVTIYSGKNVLKSYNCNQNVFSESFEILSPPGNSYLYAELCYENNNWAWVSPVFITPESFSLVKNFQATSVKEKIMVTFTAISGTTPSSFKLYRKYGGNLSKYISDYQEIYTWNTRNQNFQYSFSEKALPETEIFYMLQEITSENEEICHGIRSAVIPPFIPFNRHFDQNKQEMHFYWHENTEVTLKLYDPFFSTVYFSDSIQAHKGINSFYPSEFLNTLNYFTVEPGEKKYAFSAYTVEKNGIKTCPLIFAADIQ